MANDQFPMILRLRSAQANDQLNIDFLKNSRFIWMNSTPEVGHAPSGEDESMDEEKSVIESLKLLQQFEDALEKYDGENMSEEESRELDAIADALNIPINP